MISAAYEAGCQNVLIFEDDLEPNQKSFTPDRLKLTVDFMKQHTNWETFFFGVFPITTRTMTRRTVYPSIVRVSTLCCHAYVVNRSLMEKLYHMKWMGCEIDNMLSRNRNAYGIYPSFFYQGADKSDLCSYNDVPMKTFWFWLNETYAYYIGWPFIYLSYFFLIYIIIILALRPVRIIYWLIIGLLLIFMLALFFSFMLPPVN